MASSLRTDPRCFRTLAVDEPIVVEFRKWSRIAKDLGVESNRLSGRLRAQPWRYFPATLEFGEDLAAEWPLELWETASTPQETRHLREASIAAILERNRIRRVDSGSVRDALQKPPVQGPPALSRPRARTSFARKPPPSAPFLSGISRATCPGSLAP
jgi:hypothetical protein